MDNEQTSCGVHARVANVLGLWLLIVSAVLVLAAIVTGSPAVSAWPRGFVIAITVFSGLSATAYAVDAYLSRTGWAFVLFLMTALMAVAMTRTIT